MNGFQLSLPLCTANPVDGRLPLFEFAEELKEKTPVLTGAEETEKSISRGAEPSRT